MSFTLTVVLRCFKPVGELKIERKHCGKNKFFVMGAMIVGF